MKLGLSLPMFTADVGRPLAAAARAAAAGYDGVFAPDHLFPPGGPGRPSLEPYAVLAAVAARQPSLQVGTLVTRASLRPVGLVAKQASALDHLSGGKAILGVGAGDSMSKAEHEAFGIPFPPSADRVALLAETMQALRSLFDGRPWGGGTHVPSIRGPLGPPGHPELWVGGRSEPVLEVAARTADAWNGWAMRGTAFRTAAERLRRSADGRAVAPTWGGIVLVGDDEDDLERLREERRTKGLAGDPWQGTVEGLRGFAEELEDAGSTWLIALPVGRDDRLEVVAETLGAGASGR